MNKSIFSIMALLLLFGFTGCAEVPPTQNTPQTKQEVAQVSVSNTEEKLEDNTEVEDVENIINTAKEITIKEASISMTKKYYIYADNKEIGTVTGKFINDFGDVFTLKDLNGNVLGSEKQIKRWGTKLTRCAQVFDADNNITGYIGEEVLTNLFSDGYFFHFYDKDKNEIGTSDEIKFSLLKKNLFNDMNGNTDYVVNAHIALNDSYTITVNDTSDIPIKNAIFMVCIEDAIKDSKSKK